MSANEGVRLRVVVIGEHIDAQGVWLERDVWPSLDPALRRLGFEPVLRSFDLSELVLEDLRAEIDDQSRPIVWLVVVGKLYGPPAPASLVELLPSVRRPPIQVGASALEVFMRCAMNARWSSPLLVLASDVNSELPSDPRVDTLLAAAEKEGLFVLRSEAESNGVQSTQSGELVAAVRRWIEDVLPRTHAEEPPRSAPDTTQVPSSEITSLSRAAGDNVQFTVHRPRDMQPERWYPLLVQAHLAERRSDADPNAPDPIEEARRQADQRLGAQAGDYRPVAQDSRSPIPHAGEISFIPRIDGVEFNPARRAFMWLEDVHTEDFRCKADRELDGETARGSVSVFLGSLLVADIAIAIPVHRGAAEQPAPHNMEAEGARPYRKIFPSYSHHDTDIVRQCAEYAGLLGDVYLRDAVALRSGEQWGPRLTELIREADVFQLFWSQNAMRSPYVRSEWEYALQLQRLRPNFVRPTYWEEPMPCDRANRLPPPELEQLHFQRLGDVPISRTRSAPRAMPEVDDTTLAPAPPAAAPTDGAPLPGSSPHVWRVLLYLVVGLTVLIPVLWWLMEGH